jgi:murein endopeptidase
MAIRSGRLAAAILVCAALVGGAAWAGGAATSASGDSAPRCGDLAAREGSTIHWQRSRALGEPFDGRLVRGVQLPWQGFDWFTWDPVLHRSPNRWWRRWGTDYLLCQLLRVSYGYRRAHPFAARVGITDLSRPHGGKFGERYGGLGHVSHQNGLDADVLYPRLDRAEWRPAEPEQIDTRLAQDLVNRFVRIGAQYVFVGPRTGLTGPPRIVQPLAHHDDHMHVRFYNRRP